MTRSSVALWSLLLTAFVATGCSSTRSSMAHSWVDPSHTAKPINKVLVIGLAQSPAMRRVFEQQMAAIFADNKVAAVPSYDYLADLGAPGDEAAVKEHVRAAVAQSGADAVTVTRLVKEETSQHWVEGSTYYQPESYYGGFYPYYYNAYSVVSTPGYVVEDKLYVVETNLYDVATEKLIWTGISETLNPASSVEGIDSLGKLIVKTLQQEGLIGNK